MNGQPLPAAGSSGADPGSPQQRLDWPGWLRRVYRSPQPGTVPPSTGHAETVWTALTYLARREGFTVERETCAGADGITTWRNRRIQIRPDITSAQAVIALAHQLGHVLLHGQIAKLEPSSTVPCTGIRKVEADSVAYLTAARTGIDTTPITFPHPSSWAGSDPRANPAATIKAVTTHILTATTTVTEVLDSTGVTRRKPAAARRQPAQLTAPVAPAEEIARVQDSATEFFRSQLPDSWVPGYLASRGLSPDVQEHWQTGYAPAGWDALTTHLRAKGHRDAVIEAAGLARRSRRNTLIDTFRDRAMLPIHSADGTMVAFIGRAAGQAAPGIPKYLNSPSTSVYNKSEVLFGLWQAHEALANGARPVIVEGPFDAIAATTAGHGKYVGVAPCGTALTRRHIAALAQAADLPAAGVMVAFDPDNAGRRAAVHAYHLLVPVTAKLAAVTLPAGHDPAHVLARSGPNGLAAILTGNTRPLPDLVINAEVARWSRWLRYPEGQIHALRAAAPLIAAMPPDHVARQVARLAAILKLDHATVTQAVTDALTEQIHNPRGGKPSRDSPYSPQQAIEKAATVTRLSARGKQADTDRRRLGSGRTPG
jgi:DNA primase